MSKYIKMLSFSLALISVLIVSGGEGNCDCNADYINCTIDCPQPPPCPACDACPGRCNNSYSTCFKKCDSILCKEYCKGDPNCMQACSETVISCKIACSVQLDSCYSKCPNPPPCPACGICMGKCQNAYLKCKQSPPKQGPNKASK